MLNCEWWLKQPFTFQIYFTAGTRRFLIVSLMGIPVCTCSHSATLSCSFPRSLSPAPKTSRSVCPTFAGISALIQKVLRSKMLARFGSRAFFFCMQDSGFSVLSYTRAQETCVTWQPPGRLSKPSLTPEYLFHKDNIIIKAYYKT